MGLRIRQSFKLGPFKINVGRTLKPSLTIGGSPFTVNLSEKGATVTVGLKGTGVSYSKRFK